MNFQPPDPYEVTRSEVAAFDQVVGRHLPGDFAPPTFVNVVLEPAVRMLIDSGVFASVRGAVHTSESVSYSRMLQVGDRVTTQLTVTDVRQRSSVTQFETLGVISDESGIEIARVTSSLMFETPEQPA
jgi:hypothetical protein